MKQRRLSSKFVFYFSLIILSLPLRAQIVFTDDNGNKVRLERPATRIISLAPHITETLFAAGAGKYIVGVVSYSDYPPAATRIQQIGSYKKLDIEAIVALKPDLVVAWGSGNDKQQIEQLQKLGLTVYIDDPRKVQDIADAIEDYGRMVNNMHEAIVAAKEFRLKYRDIWQTYANRTKLRGFYQVWNKPLITINGQHLISDVMRICGIDNMFADMNQLAPRISVESVIEKDPQIIIASGMGEAKPEWLDDWRKWKTIQAVKYNNLFFIPPSIIQRHAPRILEAAEQLCQQAQTARENFSKPQAQSMGR